MNALAQKIVDRLSDRLGGCVEKYAASNLIHAVKVAASETDTNPTDAQKESGNYRKGRFSWNGMKIVIENPAGSVRSGKSKSGHEWSIKMPIHYGYIARTESDADGDAIDVFVGPHPESDIVFVVDQQSGDSGDFDEHKVIIGYSTAQDAKEAYQSCYSSGWKGLKSITPMTVDQFKAWLDEGSSEHPIAGQVSKYAKRGPLAGQRQIAWKEEDHPRDQVGKFSEAGHELVTVPESRGVPAFQAEVRNRPDGTAAIHRTEGEGKDRPLATMHGSQVKTFLGDLVGKVTSDTRTNDDSVNKVLDQKAKFISRGNDGLAFDTGDGNVVKAGSDLAYHWSNGIRQPGEGAKRTKEAAELNNKLRAEGVPGLLEQTVIEHDGRTFLKMPKLTIPEKLTRQQLEQVQKTVTELNKRGYAIGDELQPGLDSQGNAHIYDTGSLAKSGQYGIDDDMDHLKRLFEKNGEKFDNPDAGLAYESQFTEVHDHLKRSPRHGVNHWQRMIDRLEEKWKPLDNDTKSFLAESHFTALAQLDARKAEAHARKDESAPLPAPAPEKKPEKKLTAVAGMQQGLFNGGERAGGQKSLFNVVKPSSKDKPTGNSEPKLTGRMADFLAKKDTISPADLAVPLAPKSLPGQKAFFSLMQSGEQVAEALRMALFGAVEKYRKQYDPNEEGHWVTIDGNHVFIKDSVAGDHAKSMGKVHRVKAEHIQHLMPEAHKFLVSQIEQREAAKALARKLSRLNSGSIARIENNYRDWSSVDGFDAIARDVALAHPDLGFDPDDTDTPGKVWDLIREGKQEYPAKDSAEVAELAAKWLKSSTPATKQEYPEDALEFSRERHGQTPEKYAFSEADHPRDEIGRFVDKAASFHAAAKKSAKTVEERRKSYESLVAKREAAGVDADITDEEQQAEDQLDIAESEEEDNRLDAEIAEAGAASTADESIDALDQEEPELAKELAVAERNHKRLSGIAAKLREKSNRLKEAAEAGDGPVTAEVRAAISNHKRLASIASKKRDKANALKEVVSALEQKKKDAEAKVESYSGQIAEFDNRQREAIKRYVEISRDPNATDDDMTAAESEVDRLEKEESELERMMRPLHAAVERLEEKLDRTMDAHQEAEDYAVEAEENAAEAFAEIDEAKQSAAMELFDEADADADSAESDAEESRQELESLRAEHAKTIEQRDELKSLRARLPSMIAERIAALLGGHNK